MRKIIYVSGTRADFGLMQNTLMQIQQHPHLDISICATGMHLSKTYGLTVEDIKRSGLPICATIAVNLEKPSGHAMAQAIGEQLLGMIKVFAKEKPDLVLLLGDRGEMLAAATAASHLNIHVAHIHGGERSGTIDESVRHAVSKFSHFHFVATANSRERLIKMGENPEYIFVTGAPGLDEITLSTYLSREHLCKKLNLDNKRPLALSIFHPVVQEIESLQQQTQALINAALKANLQLLHLTPNSDAGSLEIRQALKEYEHHKDIRFFTHLERSEYLAWMAASDVMIGNSSSAIIEAASFQLPVVNVGSRQNLRERGNNVMDTETKEDLIYQTIQQALVMERNKISNIYGDGKTGERITQHLAKLPLTKSVLSKSNAY